LGSISSGLGSGKFGKLKLGVRFASVSASLSFRLFGSVGEVSSSPVGGFKDL
jgi:hypothetical protein